MLLQHRLNEITSHIAGYQSQIDELNTKIAALQAHAQKVGSVEAAMESAVSQLQVAIVMVRSVCPDELAEFQSVIAAQFGEAPIAELPEAAEPTTAPTEPTVPSNPNAPEVFDNWEDADRTINATEPNKCIDPTAEAIDVTADKAIAPDDSDSSDTIVMPKPEWHYLTWPQLVKYAASKGIKVKGKTRGELESELLAM